MDPNRIALPIGMAKLPRLFGKGDDYVNFYQMGRRVEVFPPFGVKFGRFVSGLFQKGFCFRMDGLKRRGSGTTGAIGLASLGI